MLTSPLNMNVLAASYPPSEGRFQEELVPVMREMMQFLNETGSHLTVNVYPFFPTYLDPSIPLSLPLFRGEEGYYDGEFHYTNMLDAMVDAVVCAMEKEGFANLPLVVGEVGWPTGGDAIATVENARVFNNYLVGHVVSGQGTPRRPGRMQMYIFELLDEDLKPTEIGPFEVYWGLNMMNGTPKYEIDLTTGWSPDLTRREKWCVALPILDSAAAKRAIDWACGQPSMDCAPIRAEGSGCRVGADTSRDAAAWRQMAGYAINLYYQSRGQAPNACSFENLFQVTTTDPSTATCKHPGRPDSLVIPQRNANETTGRGEEPPPAAGGGRIDGVVGGRRGGAGAVEGGRTGAGHSDGDADGHVSSWCVAAPGTSTPALQNGLDWACGPGRVDCNPIKIGGDCFFPNTVRDHASYAYNTYYQRENKQPQACAFGGTAVVVHEDPSNGKCVYPGRNATESSPLTAFSSLMPTISELKVDSTVEHSDGLSYNDADDDVILDVGVVYRTDDNDEETWKAGEERSKGEGEGGNEEEEVMVPAFSHAPGDGFQPHDRFDMLLLVLALKLYLPSREQAAVQRSRQVDNGDVMNQLHRFHGVIHRGEAEMIKGFDLTCETFNDCLAAVGVVGENSERAVGGRMRIAKWNGGFWIAIASLGCGFLECHSVLIRVKRRFHCRQREDKTACVGDFPSANGKNESLCVTAAELNEGEDEVEIRTLTR
ncbi:hypothetical protein CBR_g63954, partial [Chara braunii]